MIDSTKREFLSYDMPSMTWSFVMFQLNLFLFKYCDKNRDKVQADKTCGERLIIVEFRTRLCIHFLAARVHAPILNQKDLCLFYVTYFLFAHHQSVHVMFKCLYRHWQPHKQASQMHFPSNNYLLKIAIPRLLTFITFQLS